MSVKRSHITKPFAIGEVRGANSKFTPERVKIITDLIAKGVKFRHAAVKSGITENTFHSWMFEHPTFSTAVREAQADFCEKYVVRMDTFAEDSWNATAWMLERVLPEDYGRKVVEISGPGGGPIAITAIQQGGDIASAIRNNPAAFAEHESLLSGHCNGEIESGGIRDDNDANGKREVASRKVSPSHKPRARGRVQGKNTKTHH